MALRLFNTMGRSVQEFKPLKADSVGMYCCGPTVYNYAHIGNLRTYVFEDVLRRALEYHGYSVRHVMNVTDVGHLTDDADEGEDKMMVGARQRNMTVWEIAEHFTKAFFSDLDELNILSPTVICKATEHIEDMQSLVSRLEERGLTYEAGGNVYYSIRDFPGYGKMALLDREGLQAGARIEVDGQKRDPHDFVLWFTKSKFAHQAMLWDSPWGRGYPGWHLECSAMSMKYLGESIDIHCGGVDHINVHHTNEIAQSEGATGKPWVNFWMHGEFLVMGEDRMGKSEGNSITLSTLKDRGYDPLDYRYYLFGAHYRTQLQFSWDALDAAKKSRKGLSNRVADLANASEPTALDSLTDSGRAALDQIMSALSDDLNVPQALGLLWNAVKDSQIAASDRLAVALEADRIFGLRLGEPASPQTELAPELLALINERENARKTKDFARADQIRDELRGRGVMIEDTPDGTKWTVV